MPGNGIPSMPPSATLEAPHVVEPGETINLTVIGERCPSIGPSGRQCQLFKGHERWGSPCKAEWIEEK